MVDIPDLITYANFGDDSEVAGIKFWLFLAHGFIVVLTTLAPRCECVITASEKNPFNRILAATLRGSRPGVQCALLIMTSLMTL